MYQLIMSVFRDIDNDVLKVVFENFFLNASLIGWPKQEHYRKELNCNIPWAILMDPTSACNLHCTGCWAAEYGNKLNLTYEELSDIVRQGKEFGTYMYIFSGGEPLVRKKDILRLCTEHSDCQFLAFTNATLIDDAFAKEMLRVKNFIPAISVEGFEDATDFRRGGHLSGNHEGYGYSETIQIALWCILLLHLEKCGLHQLRGFYRSSGGVWGQVRLVLPLHAGG